MRVHRQAGHVTSGTERVYYERFGEGDEAVVLSHGAGGNHASWHRQVPVLAERYTVVTWDQRGFGRSSNEEGDATPPAAVRDLVAILEHLEIGRAHLVGQSMGGWAVLGFALSQPDRVPTLTLSGTIAGIYTPEIEQAFLGALAAQAGTHRGGDVLGLHPAIADGLVDGDPASALLYQQLSAFNPPAPATLGPGLWTTRYDAVAVATLPMPVLVIFGADDGLFTAAGIRAAAALLPPGTEVVEVEGSGHSPYFERPDEFNRALLGHLVRGHGVG